MTPFTNGASWIRADFHLHTRADKEFSYSGADNAFVKEYVAALKAARVSIGLIANHNKFDLAEFKCLRKAARKQDIFLLPGVELSVGDGANGIHTLVVFGDDWIDGADHINPFLTTTFNGKTPALYEQENSRSSFGLIETIRQLEGYHKDFFLVFAHVEQRSGLWNELGGGRLQELGQDEFFRRRTLAFQKVVTHDVRDRPCRVKVQGWLQDAYPAEVEGSDSKSIQALSRSGEKPGVFLKVGAFTFDAVKYALQAHEHRVRQEAPTRRCSYIQSVSFDGGVFDGQTVNFSPELNTLIGIRGSGKSSLLEALRYALGLSFGERATDTAYKEGLVQHALGSGGKVTVAAVDRHGQPYEVVRIFREQPEVFIAGVLQPGVSIQQTVVHRPIYFGQKDLSSSGEGFEKDLIEKFVGEHLTPLRHQIEDQRQRVAAAVATLQKLETTEDQLSEFRAKKQDAEYRLEFYKKHGVEAKMQEQVAFDADLRRCKQALRVVTDYLRDTEAVINDHEDALKTQSSYVSRNNSTFFIAFFKAYEQVLSSFDHLQVALTQGRGALATLQAQARELEALRAAQKEEFARVERRLAEELKSEGTPIRVEEFKQVQQNLAQAQQAVDRLTTRAKQQQKARDALVTELSKLNDLWHQEFREIDQVLSSVNSGHTALQVAAEYKGDKDAALNYLRDLFRGSRIREAALSTLLDRYADFGAIYRELDQAKLQLGTSGSTFEQYFTENLSALLTWQIPNRFTILYHGRELKQHSIGQRASALMLFVLNQGDNDVMLIDQPEDDLDNQTIYQDVIKLLCALKPDKQFILATHNPNFPVLGDAEQIVACQYDSETVTVGTGSIDDAAQQEKVVNIMEGGKEAFRRRNQRYESWTLPNS